MTDESFRPAGVPAPAAGTPPVALTVAGSDSGAGAGIQADLKTFAAHGVYGCTALTAITAQNTVGISETLSVPQPMLAAQLDAVLSDFPVRAVKTGMLPTLDTVLRYAPDLPNLVVDPVHAASTGTPLSTMDSSGWRELFGYATVVTPNVPEAEALLGTTLSTPDDLRDAAAALAKTGARCVVVKGGHLSGAECPDAVWYEGRHSWLSMPRVATGNTHGTGCTFAAAIAANLAAGRSVPEALVAAKRYLTAALRAASTWRLGSGTGPLNHHIPGGIS